MSRNVTGSSVGCFFVFLCLRGRWRYCDWIRVFVFNLSTLAAIIVVWRNTKKKRKSLISHCPFMLEQWEKLLEKGHWAVSSASIATYKERTFWLYLLRARRVQDGFADGRAALLGNLEGGWGKKKLWAAGHPVHSWRLANPSWAGDQSGKNYVVSLTSGIWHRSGSHCFLPYAVSAGREIAVYLKQQLGSFPHADEAKH